MEKLIKFINKEAKIIVASVLMGFIITIGITTKAYSDRISAGISEKFIRFHVVANSDTDADQALKLKVRDGVLSAIKDDVEACESIEETRLLLERSLGAIEEEAERIMAKEGRDYTARASIEHIMFPTREYGDIVLGAGLYEALRIELGSGAGKNWWCVVYPPLCYVDVTQGAVSESTKSQLRRDFTEEEYKFLVKDESVSVRIKFKVVELWQEGKMVAQEALKR